MKLRPICGGGRREDGKQAARREVDARERDPNYVSDAYAECYPGYHEYAPAVVDSDDEDLSHMDTKDKGQGRADFETEEQWQARCLPASYQLTCCM